MILGVHHPALAVSDMQKALDFYCGVVGFEPVMEADIPSGVEVLNTAMGVSDGGYKVRMLRKGNSCIELFEFANTTPGTSDRPVDRQGITHFALASDDFQQDYDHLAANGVKFNAQPFGASPLRFAYGRDPFGNVIELLEHAPEGPTSLSFAD